MHILLTGAASGIGRAIADLLVESGHTVYAVDIKDVQASERLISYKADVTCALDMVAVAGDIRSRGTKLDAILCVAGMHTMASLVEADYAELHRLIEVNLCGAMLTVNSFHPLLSESGRVVIVTSEVAAYEPMPFNGLYSVSKTALDTYAEALRRELSLIGQRVVTVRPGAIETPLCTSSLTATERLAEETALYKKQAKHFLGLTKRFMGKPMRPDRLAPIIYKAVTKARPRAVYSKHRSVWLRLMELLPASAQRRILRFMLNR